MFKRLFGTVVLAAATALGAKVVKDILDADEEEEKKLIELPAEEKKEDEE